MTLEEILEDLEKAIEKAKIALQEKERQELNILGQQNVQHLLARAMRGEFTERTVAYEMEHQKLLWRNIAEQLSQALKTLIRTSEELQKERDHK